MQKCYSICELLRATIAPGSRSAGSGQRRRQQPVRKQATQHCEPYTVRLFGLRCVTWPIKMSCKRSPEASNRENITLAGYAWPKGAGMAVAVARSRQPTCQAWPYKSWSSCWLSCRIVSPSVGQPQALRSLWSPKGRLTALVAACRAMGPKVLQTYI